jgi:hypothetical protein
VLCNKTKTGKTMSMPKETKILAALLGAFYLAAGVAMELDSAAVGARVREYCLTGAGLDVPTQIIVRPNSCLTTPGTFVARAAKAFIP